MADLKALGGFLYGVARNLILNPNPHNPAHTEIYEASVRALGGSDAVTETGKTLLKVSLEDEKIRGLASKLSPTALDVGFFKHALVDLKKAQLKAHQGDTGPLKALAERLGNGTYVRIHALALGLKETLSSLHREANFRGKFPSLKHEDPTALARINKTRSLGEGPFPSAALRDVEDKIKFNLPRMHILRSTENAANAMIAAGGAQTSATQKFSDLIRNSSTRTKLLGVLGLVTFVGLGAFALNRYFSRPDESARKA